MSKVVEGCKGKLYIKDKLIGTLKGGKMTDKTGIIVDDLTKTESSNVFSVAYQESNKKAFVTFKNGGLYGYKDVEKEDFEALRDAESVGRHLSSVFLKKGFEFEKLENTELLLPTPIEDISVDDTILATGEKVGDLDE